MNRPNVVTRIGKPAVLQKLPIVEITGHSRVLVENHMGVLSYSLEEIQMKVSFGKLQINGCSLKIMQLSKEQMVICGNIDSVQLFRR